MSTPAAGTRTVLEYAVDIVLCIDATLSMKATLDNVRHGAMTFHTRLAEAMVASGRGISSLRLKVVAFRDFGDDPSDALSVSRFFTIPDETAQFEAVVRGLTAEGGGDVPESGLEALAAALDSPWETGLDRRRHVIVVFTDAPAHPLGSVPGFPASLDELFAQWGHAQSRGALMENSAKRLLIFAPEEYPWTDIADDWNNTLFFPSEAGEGLEEWELDVIIATIANSL